MYMDLLYYLLQVGLDTCEDNGVPKGDHQHRKLVTGCRIQIKLQLLAANQRLRTVCDTLSTVLRNPACLATRTEVK